MVSIVEGREMTRNALKSAARLLVLGAVLLLPVTSNAAITLDGTVPVGRAGVVLIQANHQTGATGVVKFKFSAPQKGAYTLGFCIGPASNPCGMSTSYVVQVMGGESQFAIVNASVFENNVLVVQQGTSTPAPFSVTME
jgi:hypothetical protein